MPEKRDAELRGESRGDSSPQAEVTHGASRPLGLRGLHSEVPTMAQLEAAAVPPVEAKHKPTNRAGSKGKADEED